MKPASRPTASRAVLTTLAMFASLANRWLLRELTLEHATPDQAPTTGSLRKLLQLVLISDSDLEAFCLDHFPTIQRRFAHGMERTQKLNILLEHADATEMLEWLGEDHPHKLSKYVHVLRYD